MFQPRILISESYSCSPDGFLVIPSYMLLFGERIRRNINGWFERRTNSFLGGKLCRSKLEFWLTIPRDLSSFHKNPSVRKPQLAICEFVSGGINTLYKSWPDHCWEENKVTSAEEMIFNFKSHSSHFIFWKSAVTKTSETCLYWERGKDFYDQHNDY